MNEILNEVLNEAYDNSLVKVNDKLFLTKKEISIIKKYKIPYENMNLSSVLFCINDILESEDLEEYDYEELDTISISIAERNYYNSNK